MLSLLLLTVVGTSNFAPPTLWASGFAAPPRIPLVGDVDNDGYADLICVYPPGGSIIDVSLNQKGQKAGVPFQALNPWGKDCQAAVVGNFDDKSGADVAGLFDGDTIRLAHGFENGKFKDSSKLIKLPKKLIKPVLSVQPGYLIVSTASGEAFAVDPRSGDVKPMKVGKNLAWIGRATVMDSSGRYGYQGPNFSVDPQISTRLHPDSRPDERHVGNWTEFVAGGLTQTGHVPKLERLQGNRLPEAPSRQFLADVDNDGDLDVVEFRYGTEKHTAFDIFIYRRIGLAETDTDADGLTNDKEAELKSDPLNPDTDNDGLLDGWETGVYRELDFKSLGCSPTRMDLICLISRYSNVDEGHVKRELDRVQKTYAGQEVTNPDGTKGWNFHAVYLPVVEEKDHPNPWWVNRDKFRPAKWKGVVHWMQITPGGGGQSDQMGDAGTCGANSLWAVFLHEFGHQIGMDHEGFWQAGLCPIYTSLMNYAYSYGVEDDGNKIRYSNGKFKDYVLDEKNLDETIPLPYDEVKFLEKGPYRFRLKPNGKTTLIDWNWNGIFGEKKVKADINYSYSTNAGRRDDLGKLMTSPWLFTHQGRAWTIYGTHAFPGDPKTDPTVSPAKPGALFIRKLKAPFQWEEPRKLAFGKLVGDPVAASKDGWIYAAFAAQEVKAASGVFLLRCRESGKDLQAETPVVLSENPKLVPTIGAYGDILFVFLWNPETGEVTYRTLTRALQLSAEKRLLRRSTIPVGMTVDTLRDEIILGAAEDQDKNRPTRWQIRRMKEANGHLIEKSVEWIEGEAGGARGYGRCTVLFDASKEAGKDGRIYFYGRGMTSNEVPWACTYVAHQIADKTVRGGWLVKRFYDEWTQSRSAPAAAWFKGDIIWAYRWVDGGQGDRDNIFHVGYRALGIDEQPMGDHDDISFFRDIGIRHSIVYLGK